MTAISNTDQSNASSAGGRSGLHYLLVGSGIGAALALLFAPKSGTAFRSDISDITHRGYDKTAEIASLVREQSVNLFQTAKEKAGVVIDMTRSQVSDLSNKAGETASGVSNELAAGVERLEEKFGEHQTNSSRTGRRSSSIV